MARLAVAVATGSSKRRWNGPEWVLLAAFLAFALIYVEDVIASMRAKRQLRASSVHESKNDEDST